MRYRPGVLVVQTLILLLLFGTELQSQTEAQVSQFFEGKMVVVKIDMPGTQLGVDVYPERSTPIDLKSYSQRLKQYGTALRAGDPVMITKVKVKDKLIEVQLGGGGFGTFRDDTNTSVFTPPTAKSGREKDLEAELKTEMDPKKRRQIQNKLDDLKNKRDQMDKQNQVFAAEASARKEEMINDKRLQGGSRFNLKYTGAVPAEALTGQALMKALAQYVTFPQESFGGGDKQ